MVASATASCDPTSLYVGDLHPSVEESQLHGVFSEIGDVSSVRICTDMLTGLSLCYGYVNFVETEDASLAIEKLNNTLLNGRMIRVMWSERNADARNSGIGNVFVKNLDESIENVKLYDIFSTYGKILSCKVVMGLDGKSKGYGFVQFDSEESAKSAIENVNGLNIEGKEIYVAHFVKKSDRASSSDVKLTSLYMKNLDKDLTEGFLKERFSEFGKITNLVILKDDYGNSKGVGFVNFKNSNNAKQAMEATNGTQFGTKTIYVEWAQKKEDRKQIVRQQSGEWPKEKMQKNEGLNVYIKNISDDVTDDELQELFLQYGTVRSTKIMRDEKGISRGFGFVSFSTPEEATTAVNSLHGYMFHRKPLFVAIAEKKEERQAKWQLQYSEKVGEINSAPAAAAAAMSAGYPYDVYYAPSPGLVSQQSLMNKQKHFGLAQQWFEPDGMDNLSTYGAVGQPNRVWMNGNMLFAGGHSLPYMQRLGRPTQTRSNNQQTGRKNHAAKGQRNQFNNRPATSSSAKGGPKMMKSSFPQHQQKPRVY